MWTSADFNNTRWVERINSAFYMAKHGDDRNDGHPARPVASLNRVVQLAVAAGQSGAFMQGSTALRPIVCASGVYNESADLTSIYLIGDGFVTFDGAMASAFVLQPAAFAIRAITIQNYGNFGVGNLDFSLYNCIVRNVNMLNSNVYVTCNWNFYNCLLQNFPASGGSFQAFLGFSLNNCTLINSNWEGNGWYGGANIIIRNSYLDSNSKIGTPNLAGLFFNPINSNIQGTLRGLRLADYQQQYGNAVDCVSTPPGFNNPTAGDYTLASTSQMRNLSFDGGFVGAYGIGINFSGLADADFLTNAQWNSTLGAFVLNDPAQKGMIEFVAKDFMRNWILLESLLVGQEDNIDNQTIDATLSYDVDGFGAPANVQSGGLESGYSYWNYGYDKVTYKGQEYLSGQFLACTDSVVYSAVGTGKVVKLLEAPNIRLYEMKFSTVSAVDCVSRPWQYFVFNKVPTVDAAGRSNGDPLFNAATANPVTVRWLKLRVTLMPNSLA